MHPYLPQRLDGIWILADAPGNRDPRSTEVVSDSANPTRTVRQIEELEIGRHFIAAISDLSANLQEVKAEYKSLGYRLMKTEGFYVHTMQSIPEFESDPQVRLVVSRAELGSIPRQPWQRRHFDPRHRFFCAWDDTVVYGWVTSIPYEDMAWVSGLYVREEYRNRGFGKALMSALLREDRKCGVQRSVLLSSRAGARVYPSLGYNLIGNLQLYCLG